MQIDPTNTRTGEVAPKANIKPASKPQASGPDTVNLAKAEAINTALRAQTEARVEAIEKAQNLIGQVKWPPPEAIHQFSKLLASNWTD